MNRAAAVFLVLFALGTGAAAAQDDAGCAAAGAARLGRAVRDLRAAALAAAQSSNEACVVQGLALADVLDRPGFGACSAAERLAGEDPGGGAELAAYRSALEWRCGHVSEAHRLARAAIGADQATTLAWRTLGQTLESRYRDAAARAAFEKALALDPEDTAALNGISEVTEDRAARRLALERYVAAGPAREEPLENIKGARESLALLDALGERQVWILEKAELPGALPLESYMERFGTISGWIARLALGPERKVPTLVDSGASGLYVDARLARSADIAPLTSSTLLGGGGSGEHASERGTIAQVGVGPLQFRDGLAFVGPDSLHERGAYRAILGLNLFGGLLVRFEPRERRLLVAETATKDAETDPLVVDPWAIPARAVPVYQLAGQLLVPVTFEGETGSARVLALLDTGAAGTLLDERVAERIGPVRRGGLASGVGYGGSMNLLGQVRAASVEIGRLRENLRDLAVLDLGLRARLGGVAIGGYIGEDVWSRNGFELDLASGVLRPAGRF